MCRNHPNKIIMSTDTILLILLAISLVCTYFFAGILLKSDNFFRYRNGRALRGWDILFAVDKKKLDSRLQNMSEETLRFFKKWIDYDLQFAPLFHLSVAIILYFAKRAYSQEGFHVLFDILIYAQVLSFISHIITDIMLKRSVRTLEMHDSMRFFNLNVFAKIFFPVIGCFVSFATLVLVWFRFMNKHSLPVATLLFMIPPVVVIIIMMITKAISAAKKNDLTEPAIIAKKAGTSNQ